MALKAQFKNFKYEVHQFSFTRTENQINKILDLINIDNNPIGGSIKLAKSGSGLGADDVFVVNQAPVPVGSTVEVMSGNKVVLQNADVLQFQSDTASSLDATISLLEIT